MLEVIGVIKRSFRIQKFIVTILTTYNQWPNELGYLNRRLPRRECEHMVHLGSKWQRLTRLKSASLFKAGYEQLTFDYNNATNF